MAHPHTAESIQVIVRVRPWNEKEKVAGTVPVVHTDNQLKTVSVVRRSEKAQTKQTKFQGFRAVLTGFTSQKEVFESSVEPLVHEVLHGFSATAFAYGQTGTGKTWTMEGDITDEENYGIIPRSSHLIFDTLGDIDRFESSRVSVTYLEIYNEELFDLLLPVDKEESKLRIVEDKSSENRGVYCMGLTETQVESAAEVVEILHRADEKRRVEETKMNKASSRSHCLFTICVTAREIVAEGRVMERTARLHLVDLAGSESAKTAGGNQDRGRERKNINQSLLALGRVITALQSVSKDSLKDSGASIDLAGRVPYRDSKLTRLLQEALGGKSKTCIVATCSPSELAVDETVSTLGYAQRACGIKNRPTQNQMMSGVGGGLSRPSGGFGGGSTQDWADMELRLSYMETQVREAQFELAKQHEMQKEATERAEAAEEVVAGLEEKVEQSQIEIENQINRVKLLHGRLSKRHVHVAELRHLIHCRKITEEELILQGSKLIETLNKSIDINQYLFSNSESFHLDAENRRKLGLNYVEITENSHQEICQTSDLFCKNEEINFEKLNKESKIQSIEINKKFTSFNHSLNKIENEIKSKLENYLIKLKNELLIFQNNENNYLNEMRTNSNDLNLLTIEQTNVIYENLNQLFNEISNCEKSLLLWTENTKSKQMETSQILSNISINQSEFLKSESELLNERYLQSLLVISENTNSIQKLLTDLATHAQEAEDQRNHSAEAQATATASLLSAEQSLDQVASNFTDLVKSQREGQTDQSVLEEISKASTNMSDSAERQVVSVNDAQEEVSCAQKALLAMVEEQKASQKELVKTVIEQVTKTLEEQTCSLFSKLDAAAEALAAKHASVTTKHDNLKSDVKDTFQTLTQSCELTSTIVNQWAESDNKTCEGIDQNIVQLTKANEKAQTDAKDILEMHTKANEEGLALEVRTKEETAAVERLQASVQALNDSEEESRGKASEMMVAFLEGAEEWTKTDAEAMANDISAIEELVTQVRADFLARTEVSIQETQILAKESLVNAVKEKVDSNIKFSEESSKFRNEKFAEFTSTSNDIFLGSNKQSCGGGDQEDDGEEDKRIENLTDSAESSVYPYLKGNCDELRDAITSCSEVEEQARDKNRKDLADRNEAVKTFDKLLKEWSSQRQDNLQTFGNDVLRMNTVIEMPPPLPPIEFKDTLAFTKPHDILLQELHQEAGAQSLEATMLRRVENLLKAHAMAVEREELPFHDATEHETAETTLDPLAYEVPRAIPTESHVVSLDDDHDDINPLLAGSNDFELGVEISDMGSKF